MKEIVIRELNDLTVAIEGGISKRTTRQSLKALTRWIKAAKSASWINAIVPKEKTTFGELADELASDEGNEQPTRAYRTDRALIDDLEVYRERLSLDMGSAQKGIDLNHDDIKSLKIELKDVHQKVRALTSAFNTEKRRKNK